MEHNHHKLDHVDGPSNPAFRRHQPAGDRRQGRAGSGYINLDTGYGLDVTVIFSGISALGGQFSKYSIEPVNQRGSLRH